MYVSYAKDLAVAKFQVGGKSSQLVGMSLTEVSEIVALAGKRMHDIAENGWTSESEQATEDKGTNEPGQEPDGGPPSGEDDIPF